VTVSVRETTTESILSRAAVGAGKHERRAYQRNEGNDENRKGGKGNEGVCQEMTRGRPPRKARWEAARSAAHQGEVLEAAGIGRSGIDFILFVRHLVLFIRVKRSHSRIRSIQELRVQFSDEIAGLHTIPLTAVVSRELWVLLPWGAWQYFCIGEDGIREIRIGNRMGSDTEEHAEVVQGQGE